MPAEPDVTKYLPEIPFDVSDWGDREVKEPLLKDKTPEQLAAADKLAAQLRKDRVDPER